MMQMSRIGQLSNKQHLLALDLLPLTFDMEVKDMVFMFKALSGYVNFDVTNCVSFVSQRRTRLNNTSKYILQGEICRTNTFKSSHYNCVVILWSIVCKDVCLDNVSSPVSFKCFVKRS